ncbi:unnamed protein product [Rotaria socialis]|uniref:Condensin complex subunit 2 n=1 Tax=Rotaria socialis TaxID=392032 RepID=A0A820IUV8_9BILA|nr:unnamed protein product [Rotaria socialis]CAF4314685.1 unnamed protein product [Rotaria socialis]
MLSLSSSQLEPSALLSHARLTIESLIQRPSTITTSNAFDEFSILDQLIDVSNDVDRFEDGENRKFLNIAQLITASTCIYSRRVDALYQLINTFQSSSSSSQNKIHDENISDEDQESESIIMDNKPEENQPKKIVPEKKKRTKAHNHSFICHDLSKINLNPSKNFFLDRTSLVELQLFQKHVPIGNQQFWMNDHQPIIFDLLFHEQFVDFEEDYQQPEQLIDVLNKLSPIKQQQPSTFDDNDIPLPIPAYDDEESSSIIEHEKLIGKTKSNRSRSKKVKLDIDLNIFRTGLTDEQQERFCFHKMRPISNRIKIEQKDFFIKKFNRNHFDKLIKDCPTSVVSIFIPPTITIQHVTIRERYSIKIDASFSRTIRSPPIPLSDVLNDDALMPLPLSPTPSFTYDINEDIQEDVDIRLQTDMEQMLDAATQHSNEEQQHNKIFLELRSLIVSYMNQHDSVQQVNADDLLDSLNDNYCLPLVFSQLLHLCGATQRYALHSTSNDNLFIEKLI